MSITFVDHFFLKGDKDYTVGQISYTLLYKEKIIISTYIRVVQYDRLSPIKRDNHIEVEETTINIMEDQKNEKASLIDQSEELEEELDI